MLKCSSEVRSAALLSLLAAFGVGMTAPSASAITLTTLDTAVVENFDSMGGSGTAPLPAGFRLGSGANPVHGGGTTATTTRGGTLGTFTQGGAYNFGDGAVDTATDRALGFLNSSAFNSPRSIMVQITNNTGAEINELDIAFDYEKYRTGSRAFGWTTFVSTDGITWVANTFGDQSYAADANNNVYPNPPLSVPKTGSITGLNIANGGSYYIRWNFAGVGGSTNGQAIGIDNVSITGKAAAPADTTAPTVVSINRASAELTNSSSVSWEVTFSEDVVNVAGGNFATALTGGLTGGAIGTVTGTGSVYTVQATGLAGDGNARLDLATIGTIEDLAGNPLAATFTTGQSYSIDQTAPQIVTFALAASADSGAINSDGITNISALVLEGTTEPNSSVVIVRDGGNDVTVNADTFGGFTLTTSALSVGSYTFSAQATDAAGNVGSPSADFDITIDTNPPVVTISAPAFKVEGNIALTVSAIDPENSGIDTQEVFVALPGSDNYVSIGDVTSYTPTAGTGFYRFTGIATDLAGNVGVTPTTTALFAPSATVLYNAVANGPVSLTPVAGTTQGFPMTDDNLIEIEIPLTTVVNGPFTVSRALGNVAPAGYNASLLLDESLDITGDFTGTVSLLWRVAPGSVAGFTGILDTAFRVEGSNAPVALPISAVAGDLITIENVSAFSTWYVGDATAANNNVGDWMILAD